MDIVLRMLFDSIPRECSTNAYSRSSDLSLRMFGLPSLMASDLKDNEHRTCESQQRVCARISLASQKLNALQRYYKKCTYAKYLVKKFTFAAKTNIKTKNYLKLRKIIEKRTSSRSPLYLYRKRQMLGRSLTCLISHGLGLDRGRRIGRWWRLNHV